MAQPHDILGAAYHGDDSTRFLVWAPNATQVDLRLVSPSDRLIPMAPRGRGYFQAKAKARPGARYLFRIDGQRERPDPASRSQPEGVHGPSQVVDRFFEWRDADWFGLSLQDYILYEMHVGTFTREGTFDAVIPHLDHLSALGVTAVELLPIAQSPGQRNWGYDGVFPFAVQESYGGPDGFKRLVNACHARGLAVVLDVIYNHLGPEGNYLSDYGPYFTDRYKTPWGVAVNYDGPGGDEVRRYFLENAEMWAREFHLDALRLDAVDNIFDFAASTFLEELTLKFDQLEQHLPRRLQLMIESDSNSPRLVQPRDAGGYGFDAQWTDDFHHALYTLLTGDYSSYYIDFEPDRGDPLAMLAKALREGYVYTGEHSVYRNRRRGAPSRGLPGYRHIVFAQNHDQVGNRMRGERFGELMSFDALKLAAGVVLLAPYIPLIFMGEEYGETAPFQFFSDYGEPDLVEAVKRGRREYFGSAHWEGEPPDPTAVETFERSKLQLGLAGTGKHKRLLEFYRELIGLRKTTAALRELSKDNEEVIILSRDLLQLRRWYADSQICAVFNFGDGVATLCPAWPSRDWTLLLDSADRRWAEQDDPAERERPLERLSVPGAATLSLEPKTFVLYERRESVKGNYG